MVYDVRIVTEMVAVVNCWGRNSGKTQGAAMAQAGGVWRENGDGRSLIAPDGSRFRLVRHPASPLSSFGSSVWEANADGMPLIAKQIAPRHANPNEWTCLRDLAPLHSPPFVPTLYTTFEADGWRWLLMERVRGQPLTLGQAAAWAWPDVIAFLDVLLGYLNLMHARGIAHRDIKPSNILRRDTDGYVLLDFGLATRGSDPAFRGHTPGYSPPEFFGDAPATASADMYALGATAYYLITARNPPAAARRVLCDSLLPPATFVAMPSALNDLLCMMLALPPEARPTAADARARLSVIADDTQGSGATSPAFHAADRLVVLQSEIADVPPTQPYV